MKRPGGYRGGHLIGFIIIGVVALRDLLSFQHEPVLYLMIALLVAYGVLYATQPWLQSRLPRYEFFYFPVQTGLTLVLTNLRPFIDISCSLYVPLCMQAVRVFPRRGAIILTMIYVALLTGTLLLGMELLEGVALILLYLAVCSFVISYDLLYLRTQAAKAESERLLIDLQDAHRQLQAYAAQAEELAAARERNRLARELHDSVSQAIFSIALTSQSARLLLEREPRRVPELLDRLQTITENALAQLRSLIAQLRPPSNS